VTAQPAAQPGAPRARHSRAPRCLHASRRPRPAEKLARCLLETTQCAHRAARPPSEAGRGAPASHALTLSLARAGEAGHQVVDLLKKNPAVAVPVILARLKQKDEEWCGAPPRIRAPALARAARRAPARRACAGPRACSPGAPSPPSCAVGVCAGRSCAWRKVKLRAACTGRARCRRSPARSAARLQGGRARERGRRDVPAASAVPADAHARARGRAGAR